MRLAYLIFGVSGAAGLGYQFVWTRSLALALGHEFASLLGMITAFFAGLAAGAWLGDRGRLRRADAALLYAGAELVIAISSLSAYSLLPGIGAWMGRLMGETPSALHQWSLSFALPMLLLLPATAAMGASFPAMERLVSANAQARRAVAGLYASNTAGAVAGVMLSAYVLLPALGHAATLYAFVALNLLCAAAALPLRGTPTTPSPTSSALSAGAVGLLGLTGLFGLGLEIITVRALAQVFEGTIYSYAAALAVFLLGTAGGAALLQLWARRLDRDRTLGWLLIGLAVSTQASAIALDGGREVYSGCRNLLGDTLPSVIACEGMLAALALTLPTLLMGATFSLLVQRARDQGGSVGLASAVNTAGAAFAPLIFGVILLPLAGVRVALGILGLGYLALSFIAIRPPWPAYLAALAFTFLTPGEIAILTLRPSEWLLTRIEGRLASVAIVGKGAERQLRVNNRYQMGGTGAEALRIQQRQTHVPMLLHPDPRRVLFLGVASGITAGAATRYAVTHVDAVELVPETLALLPFFEPHNMGLASHPRVRLIGGDARRFVRVAGSRYDMIIGDLFHPALDGAGALYTREHFTAIRTLLDQGGVFCQWLPAYQLDEATLKSVVATFLAVFPDAFAVLADDNLGFPALGLVGGAGRIETRAIAPDLARHLDTLGMNSDFQRFGHFIAGPRHLNAYAGNAPVGTDDHPHVVYLAPRFAAQRRTVAYGRLEPLLRGDPAEATRLGADARMLRSIASRNLGLAGRIAERDGRVDDAVAMYRRSVAAGGDYAAARERLALLLAPKAANGALRNAP